MPETRTELIRYPGVLTDWSGVYLNKKIKQQIRIGNCVRVLFANKEIQNNKHNAYTVYLTIIKKCKKNKNWFLGIVNDPYYSGDPYFIFQNGQQRAFSIHHIMEIPLTWPGNENLNKNAEFLTRRRVLTGI